MFPNLSLSASFFSGPTRSQAHFLHWALEWGIFTFYGFTRNSGSFQRRMKFRNQDLYSSEGDRPRTYQTFLLPLKITARTEQNAKSSDVKLLKSGQEQPDRWERLRGGGRTGATPRKPRAPRRRCRAEPRRAGPERGLQILPAHRWATPKAPPVTTEDLTPKPLP